MTLDPVSTARIHEMTNAETLHPEFFDEIHNCMQLGMVGSVEGEAHSRPCRGFHGIHHIAPTPGCFPSRQPRKR
jgi:hypothetical protein